MPPAVRFSMATDAERIRRLEYEVLELRKAVLDSNIALEIWLHTYADDLCDRDLVRLAYKRIEQGGGTIAYIADATQANRDVLKKYEPKFGYYCLEDNQKCKSPQKD